MIEVTAADDRGVCYNFGTDYCNLVVVAVTLVVVASIGVVTAVFAKNKGPEFEIFFQKRYFFLLLVDSFTCTIS